MAPDTLIALLKERRWNIQAFSGYPYYLSAAANPSAWEVNRTFGRGYRHFFYLCEKGATRMFYDESDWNTVYDIYKRDIKTVQKLRQYESEARERYESAAAKTRYDRDALQTLSFDELTELFVAFAWRIGFAVGLGHLIEGIEFGAEQEIDAMLEKRGIADASVGARLIALDEPSFALRARLALWKIHNAPPDAKERLAATFLREHGFIENTYLGSANLTVFAVLERAEAMEAPPELPQGIEEERNALERELRLSAEERTIVESMVVCSKWHDDRKELILTSIEEADRVTAELAKRCDLRREELLQALVEEVTATRLRDAAYLQELRDRYDGCALYTTELSISVFTKADFTMIKGEVERFLHIDVSEVRGTVAHKGKASGVVRICRTPADIAAFPAGAILVAPMTRPEFLPAMQRAAGIVTDEGGITSHAAIVARELRKPCIIGTKIATRIFKDGDRVELNTEKGVVLKI